MRFATSKRLLAAFVLAIGLACPLFAAIGADVPCGAATNGTTSQSCTLTGVSASATAAFVAVVGDTANDFITGCTVGGVAATLVDKCSGNGSNNCTTGTGRWVYLFYKASPSSGNQTVTCTASANIYIGVAASSYTGSSVTAQPEVSSRVSGNTALTGTVTVGTNNAWLIAAGSNVSGNVTGGTGTTLRVGDGFGGGNGISGLLDSNAGVSTGSQSLQVGGTAGNPSAIILASLAPAAATTTCGNLSLLGVGCHD